MAVERTYGWKTARADAMEFDARIRDSVVGARKSEASAWRVFVLAGGNTPLLLSNVFVTSSTRLDTEKPPIVGAVSAGFQMSILKHSLATKIFVDDQCLEANLAMAADAETGRISDTSILYQLRQIRSKFDHPSAYSLCPASWPLTQVHVCQPFTIFTFGDHDKGRYAAANLSFSSPSSSVGSLVCPPTTTSPAVSRCRTQSEERKSIAVS
ncbi:hypothetical protein BCR43DRAFT_104468 [Syncephalastrum racemosum]|uniref:Uncharacterized protein n=1 Tax=Syncephalastrum racemosum TaxID=13706 RepID=A0A1X2H1N0_SYNRA|nr:hypothetical protein BCR43DRAFT_104468 [Syncephalastrum racemosum]